MTYQDKLQSARAIVEEHNGNVPQENQINFDEFEQNLKGAGGTSEAALAASSWEDLVDCGLSAKLLAKQVAGIFRQKTEADSNKNPYAVSPSKAKKMSPRQLIEAYDPEEPESHVASRLKTISKGQPFIVFKSDKTVDVEASFSLYNELKQGFPPRELYSGPEGTDDPRPVFAVGYVLGKTFDENPIYKGDALRPDGSCSKTGVNWAPVSLETRQFIRIGREVGEIKIEKIKDIYDLVSTDPKQLKQMYQKTAVEFNSRKEEGKLPSLKVKMNGSKSKKTNDPFHQASAHWAS